MDDPFGPTVRDVLTFGYDVFPNARRNWPEATLYLQTLNDISTFYNTFHDAQSWCDKQFGYSNWCSRGNTFYFMNENDALLFKLRWSDVR